MGPLEWIVPFLMRRVVGGLILFLELTPCVGHGPQPCQDFLSARHPLTECSITKSAPTVGMFGFDGHVQLGEGHHLDASVAGTSYLWSKSEAAAGGLCGMQAVREDPMRVGLEFAAMIKDVVVLHASFGK